MNTINDSKNKSKSNSKTKYSHSSKSSFIKLPSFLTKIIECVVKIFSCVIKRIRIILNIFYKYSILTQFLLILIILSVIFTAVLIFIHWYFYEVYFKYDYYKALKEECYDHLNSEMNDYYFNFSTLDIKQNYIEYNNMLFFEIYYKELISAGLLDYPNDRVLPDISDISENSYIELQNAIKSSMVFTIPKDDSKKLDDNREDSLNEISKLYYLMLPIIIEDIYKKNNTINQSYIITYEFEENKNINGEEIFFMFPRLEDTLTKKYNNFLNNDLYINPLVNKTRFDHTKLINDTYYLENWFMKQDYDYRYSLNLENNDNNDCYFSSNISFSHLNSKNYLDIDKYIILTSQNFYQREVNSKRKNVIVNIFFYMEQKNVINEDLDYSIFLLNNNNNDNSRINRDTKFSDNTSFVLSRPNALELSLSSLIKEYFHHGLKDINYNFYKDGISYDCININILSEPLNYYNSIDNFHSDLRILTTLYFYGKLFNEVSFTQKLTENEDLNELYFVSENKIKEICDAINFNDYGEYLTTNGINCWNKKNLLYYMKNNKSNEKVLNEYSTVPYCICLPFYCLEDNKQYDFIKKEVSYFEKVTNLQLPDKCQNYLNFYENDYTNKLKNNQSSTSTLVNMFSSKTISQIEDKIIKFSYLNINYLPEYKIFIMVVIKNQNFKNIFNVVFKEIGFIEIFVIGLALIGSLVIFCLIIVIIFCHLRKISNIISSFKENHEKYLIGGEEHNEEENAQSEYDENFEDLYLKKMMINKVDEKEDINNGESNALLQKEKNFDISYAENPLIEFLFNHFREYCKISQLDLEHKFMKNKKVSEIDLKIGMLNEKNELFQLLCSLSLLSPYFKIHKKMNYKTYKTSLLYKKFIKYISKIRKTDFKALSLSKNILFELICTENVIDFGLESNFYFNYTTNIGSNSNFSKINSIQNSMLSDTEASKTVSSKVICLVDCDDDVKVDNNDDIKLIWKKKNVLIGEIEKNFEMSDDLKIDKLRNAFNHFLVDVYYKYMKFISKEENNSK